MNKRTNVSLINILFVTRSYPPVVGGMENFAYGLYTELSQLANVKLIANKFSSRVLGIPCTLLYAFFYSLIFGWKYDIIYANDILTGFFVLPAKLIYSKKIAVTIYGLDMNYVKNPSTKIISKVMKLIYKIIFNISKSNIAEFVAISEATKELGQDVGIKNAKLIYPGIDMKDVVITQDEKRDARNEILKRHDFSAESRILFYVGRLVKRKGILWFVSNVMSKIDPNYVLFIASDGPLKAKIVLKIQEMKLDDRVKVLGRISDEDKELYQLGADYFIMPNIKVEGDWEGFGIVAIEASMFGTPVLAAKLEGVSSAIKDAVTGKFFESGNVDDCIEKLRELEALNLSPIAINQYTKENYNLQKMANDYLQIFKEHLKT